MLIPIAAADALLAALLVAIGSCVRGDLRFLVGLPVTLAGFAVASRAMWRVEAEQPAAWRTSACALMAVMALVGLVTPATPGAAWYDAAGRGVSLLGLAAVGVFFWGDARWRGRAVAAVAVAVTALHFAAPIGVPDPGIDVWSWTQTCLRSLLHGVHPYTVQAGDFVHIGPTSQVYPYLPLTLVAYAPAFALLGDYRFLSALALPATVVLNRATGHRLGVDPRFVDATTLAFLLHPRSSWLTVYGWTEPLLVVVAAAFAYLAVRAPGGAGQAIAFFLLPALKQYFIAPVLLYLAMKPPRPRAAVVAVAATAAVATVAPFLGWAWRPTVAGIVVQMVAPLEPRLDSDSLVALVGATTGVYASRWLSIAVQLLVAAIAYARLRRHGLAGLLLASALALYATFLAGWQAFVNYYYLVGELLILAALALAAPRPRAALDSGSISTK